MWGFYSEKNSYGARTKYIKNKIQNPAISNEEEFVDFLVAFLQKHDIDAIIPLSDQSAKILSKYKCRLLSLSSYIMPDIDIFMRGYDKNNLMALCRDHNFPHPHTIDIATEHDKINDFPFPALIKPNITTGARGMTRVNSAEEFALHYPSIKRQYGDCHLQEFIEPGGGQIEIQLLVDENSDIIYSSVIYKYRFYPVNGGSSCCNTTIRENNLVTMCGAILKELKWVGFADFDLIEDMKDGIVKVMEINPRVPACVKSAVVSGIDYGPIIVDSYLGREYKNYEYSPGVILRHFGFEVLWFINSKYRWRTKPSWFRFFGKRLYYQDFDILDPMPFIFGTLGNIKKQFSSEFRKSKAGVR